MSGQAIVITSGKGGVGKTTITANVGSALASMGKKVVLVDGDTGLRNLDVIMGLENRIVYHLIDVMEEKCSLKQALVRDKRYNELFLLPTAQLRDKDDIKPKQMLDLICELRELFDYILIDCPAGIEQGFENAVVGADKAIVVINPEVTSIRDADRVIGKLEGRGFHDNKLIINKIDYEMIKNDDMLSIEDIIDILNVNLIGVITNDRNITIATNKGEPIVLDESLKIGRSFKEIAMRIMGDEIPFEKNIVNNDTLVDTLKRLFVSK